MFPGFRDYIGIYALFLALWHCPCSIVNNPKTLNVQMGVDGQGNGSNSTPVKHLICTWSHETYS